MHEKLQKAPLSVGLLRKRHFYETSPVKCKTAMNIQESFQTSHQKWPQNTINMNHPERVEVPEIINSEQCCCRDLTFFSADSENMRNISRDQYCFTRNQI